MEVSIIVPTYNERDNIMMIVPKIGKILNNYTYEIIIVDDNSPDGTADVAKRLSNFYPIKVIVRNKKMGLSSAIVDGFKNASGDVVGVIDADLQHPPELIEEMIDKIKMGYDIVVASRYVDGGGVEDWSLFRLLISKVAIILARPLTSVRDPMSGYFFLKRDIIDNINFRPRGYKLLLEILVKGRYEKVLEIPYTFTKRMLGDSKLCISEIFDYLRLLIHLYSYKIKHF